MIAVIPRVGAVRRRGGAQDDTLGIFTGGSLGEMCGLTHGQVFEEDPATDSDEHETADDSHP